MNKLAVSRFRHGRDCYLGEPYGGCSYNCGDITVRDVGVAEIAMLLHETADTHVCEPDPNPLEGTWAELHCIESFMPQAEKLYNAIIRREDPWTKRSLLANTSPQPTE